ncbi:MAG: MFS transporter [Candidatus Binataceae bacterium]|jgi:MFS family permease
MSRRDPENVAVSNGSRSAATRSAAHPQPRYERDSPHAWRMVAAGFLAAFTLFGVVYSFGAFFKPIALQFGANRSATSAIFSITSCISFILGPFTGHLADRYGPKRIAAVGAVAIGIGLGATSQINHLWAAYITYGLGVGIAIACCYVPLIAAISGWFLKRRNSALGMAASGIGVGTLVTAPAAAELIRRLGWREAYVVLAVIATALLLVCVWLIEAPPIELNAPEFFVRRIARTRQFKLMYAACMLWTVATAMPFVFLPAYAQGIGIKAVAAAALVGFIGFASTAGRLGLGPLADRFGLIVTYRYCILVLGICFSLWLYGNSYAMLVAFALVMGASYGGAVALTPAVVAELFGTRGLGVILGTLYTGCAIGTLLGPPFCGALVDRTGSYRIAILFTMAVTIVSYVILLPLEVREAERYG